MERDIPHAIAEDLDRPSGFTSPRFDPARDDFAQAVLAGFATKPRSLPCRFFYDARGSALFEEITQIEEYYPTRVETALRRGPFSLLDLVVTAKLNARCSGDNVLVLVDQFEELFTYAEAGNRQADESDAYFFHNSGAWQDAPACQTASETGSGPHLPGGGAAENGELDRK